MAVAPKPAHRCDRRRGLGAVLRPLRLNFQSSEAFRRERESSGCTACSRSAFDRCFVAPYAEPLGVAAHHLFALGPWAVAIRSRDRRPGIVLGRIRTNDNNAEGLGQPKLERCPTARLEVERGRATPRPDDRRTPLGVAGVLIEIGHLRR